MLNFDIGTAIEAIPATYSLAKSVFYVKNKDTEPLNQLKISFVPEKKVSTNVLCIVGCREAKFPALNDLINGMSMMRSGPQLQGLAWASFTPEAPNREFTFTNLYRGSGINGQSYRLKCFVYNNAIVPQVIEQEFDTLPEATTEAKMTSLMMQAVPASVILELVLNKSLPIDRYINLLVKFQTDVITSFGVDSAMYVSSMEGLSLEGFALNTSKMTCTVDYLTKLFAPAVTPAPAPTPMMNTKTLRYLKDLISETENFNDIDDHIIQYNNELRELQTVNVTKNTTTPAQTFSSYFIFSQGDSGAKVDIKDFINKTIISNAKYFTTLLPDFTVLPRIPIVPPINDENFKISNATYDSTILSLTMKANQNINCFWKLTPGDPKGTKDFIMDCNVGAADSCGQIEFKTVEYKWEKPMTGLQAGNFVVEIYCRSTFPGVEGVFKSPTIVVKEKPVEMMMMMMANSSSSPEQKNCTNGQVLDDKGDCVNFTKYLGISFSLLLLLLGDLLL